MDRIQTLMQNMDGYSERFEYQRDRFECIFFCSLKPKKIEEKFSSCAICDIAVIRQVGKTS